MEWRLRGKTQPPPCTSRHYSCFPLCPSILTHNPVPGTLDVQQPDQFPSYHCGPLLLRNQGSVTKEWMFLGNFYNFIIKKQYWKRIQSKTPRSQRIKNKIIESFLWHLLSKECQSLQLEPNPTIILTEFSCHLLLWRNYYRRNWKIVPNEWFCCILSLLFSTFTVGILSMQQTVSEFRPVGKLRSEFLEKLVLLWWFKWWYIFEKTGICKFIHQNNYSTNLCSTVLLKMRVVLLTKGSFDWCIFGHRQNT